MKKTFFTCSMAFALLFCWILFSNINPSLASDTIRVGIVTGLTGWGADLGASVKEGVNLAVEEINNNGGLLGKTIEVTYRDDESNPPKGIVAARELIYAKKVDVLLGPSFTTVNFAILPVINEAKILNLTLATGTAIVNPQKNPFTFRSNFHSKIEAEAAINYAVKKKGHQKLAILHDSSGYGKSGLAEILPLLKKEGLTALTIESYNIGDKNMTGQLLKIKQTGATAILAWGLGPDLAVVAKNMHTLGLNFPVYGGSGSNSRFFKQLAGDVGGNFLGALTKNFTFNQKNPLPARAKKYMDEITKRYGVNRSSILSNSAHSYDAIYIYAQAVQKAGSVEKMKVKAAMENLRYKGLTAETVFSPSDHEALDAKDMTMAYSAGWIPEGAFSRPDDAD
jgi:branched-chain amino acid transport system substrate-binding protein